MEFQCVLGCQLDEVLGTLITLIGCFKEFVITLTRLIPLQTGVTVSARVSSIPRKTCMPLRHATLLNYPELTEDLHLDPGLPLTRQQ